MASWVRKLTGNELEDSRRIIRSTLSGRSPWDDPFEPKLDSRIVVTGLAGIQSDRRHLDNLNAIFRSSEPNSDCEAFIFETSWVTNEYSSQEVIGITIAQALLGDLSRGLDSGASPLDAAHLEVADSVLDLLDGLPKAWAMVGASGEWALVSDCGDLELIGATEPFMAKYLTHNSHADDMAVDWICDQVKTQELELKDERVSPDSASARVLLSTYDDDSLRRLISRARRQLDGGQQ